MSTKQTETAAAGPPFFCGDLDIRIAADNSVFAIPAARLGLAYRWEDIYPLVQLIGPSFTREFLYTSNAVLQGSR